jgi:hypothetical protein
MTTSPFPLECSKYSTSKARHQYERHFHAAKSLVAGEIDLPIFVTHIREYVRICLYPGAH